MTDERQRLTQLASIRLARRVEVFGTPTCRYTRELVAYLVEQGVSFKFLGVHGDAAAAMRMIEISGQMGVPVLHARGRVVVGFRKELVDEALGPLAVQSEETNALVEALFARPESDLHTEPEWGVEDLLAELETEDAQTAASAAKLTVVKPLPDDEDDEDDVTP